MDPTVEKPGYWRGRRWTGWASGRATTLTKNYGDGLIGQVGTAYRKVKGGHRTDWRWAIGTGGVLNRWLEEGYSRTSAAARRAADAAHRRWKARRLKARRR